MTSSKDGYSLVEAVVASALLCLLVTISYLAITSVTRSAKTMSMHVSAQGICLHLFEKLKAIPIEDIPDIDFDTPRDEIQSVVIREGLDYLERQNIGIGAEESGGVKCHISCEITNIPDPPRRKNVRIKCAWTFRGRPCEEMLEGTIVNEYATYAVHLYSLAIKELVLNPNLPIPAHLKIKTASGEVYTQNDLGRIPANLSNVTYLAIYTGGAKTQPYSFNDGHSTKTGKIENSKTYVFSAGGDTPLSVQISQSNGKWMMNASCAEATLTNQ